MYILRINNNLGDPPNRLVFICRAYNTWRLTTRDTRRLRERESRRVLASQRLTKMSHSLSLRIRRGESLQTDQRVFATEDEVFAK